ncbi:MAG: hypothetical protein ACYSSI_13965 [Planctomycetota bacterium]|jgi:hypothetical protein
MELDGVSTPILPIQSGPIVQPQTVPEPPESEPEVTFGEEGGGKAEGVVSKLESGHFKGKGVADVRLRIAHFDNPELEPIDPEELLPVPEDGPSKAYEKFLEQYRALYEASQSPPVPLVAEPDTDAILEPPPEPEAPVTEIPEPDPVPAIIEEPVVEVPPVPEESPVIEESANEIPETEPVIVTPLEIEPIVFPEQTEPEVPVDEVEGALAAFEELLETQVLEEPETLDIVI